MERNFDEDLKTAMRAKDAIRVSTIRSIKAMIVNFEKANPGKSPDLDNLLKSAAKQRRQSIEGFEAGGYVEAADKERTELAIIESYLPKQMTKEEIALVVSLLIIGCSATSIKDMGKVMGAFNAMHPGQNGQLVSEAIKSQLILTK